ncbi:tetratricopeptide repeat protein [Arenibaculum pallidiluteum]|uniref:tetratricopeptide repeat protein n=1 Tax=Arenibaculum pallidiluteum TaxID=2812559 RepID=UPI001A964333|nr:tetratricopeptide repeat protein [Arenibaculum pallidiluteum]
MASPTSPGQDALAAAHALAEAGNPKAEAAYRGILQADPADAEALGGLGFWLAAAGRPREAAEALRRAAWIDTGTMRWLRAWAEAEEEAGRIAEAAEVHGRILERRPDDAVSHRKIGDFRRITGESGDAVRHYREALHLDPSDSAALLGLGGLLVETGDAVAALELLQPRMRRDPDDLALVALAARAWAAVGERGKAMALVARALDLDPEDPFGLRGLADALATADALSPAFVRGLFDTYADRFDRDLLGRLDYRAPAILREATAPLLAGRGELDVLDIGCGTGLAGIAFRDAAAFLEGSDLSPRMVDKAAARGIYDRLEVAELRDSLGRRPAARDLVIAADVLVYLGDLHPVFSAVAEALRPGGMLAATAERLEGEGFVLGATRRYAHGEAHLRAAAAASGLEVAILDHAVPRREKGQPVPGWVFVLRKPG